MRSLILATAVWAGLSLAPAAARDITVHGPDGAVTVITPGVWGKDTFVVTPIVRPTPPPPPPEPLVVKPPVYAPLPPTITHTPDSPWYNR